MEQFLQGQLFAAIIILILTTILTFVSSYFLERQRAKKEIQQKLLIKRLETYETLMELIKNWRNLIRNKKENNDEIMRIKQIAIDIESKCLLYASHEVCQEYSRLVNCAMDQKIFESPDKLTQIIRKEIGNDNLPS
ncbi:MAG: hypothetical protein LBB23_03055 [Rickettsiales bacterium]|jgi:hypothetical protein|nr:hypothetical protein [Rickettsiales bacterium]